MNNYTLGNTFTDKYLNKDETRNTRVTNIKKTSYGYRVQMFNNYITLFYIKLIVNADGSAKAHVKMDKNYQPLQRWTVYFSTDGREIIAPNNDGELAIYNKLRKSKS